MKRTDILILSLSVGFLVIAIYETINFGLPFSYWWFMASIGLLFYYVFRRRSREEKEQEIKNKNRR